LLGLGVGGHASESNSRREREAMPPDFLNFFSAKKAICGSVKCATGEGHMPCSRLPVGLTDYPVARINLKMKPYCAILAPRSL
jgi:hypothetical protein